MSSLSVMSAFHRRVDLVNCFIDSIAVFSASIISSRSWGAACYRLSCVGCWWRCSYVSLMFCKLVLRAICKAGHSALVQLNYIFNGRGIDSSELYVNLTCITLRSDPVVVSSATAQSVTRSIVLGVTNASFRTNLPCPVW